VERKTSRQRGTHLSWWRSSSRCCNLHSSILSFRLRHVFILLELTTVLVILSILRSRQWPHENTRQTAKQWQRFKITAA